MASDPGSIRAAELVVELTSEIRENTVRLAEFGVELKNMKLAVDGLSKVVKDGNGHSLVTKMAVAEGEIKQIKKTIESSLGKKLDELEDRIDDAGEKEIDVRREGRNQKLQFYGAFIPAMLAFAASILALIYG